MTMTNHSEHQDLVELLLLAIYQDGHLSIEEDSMLQKALSSLGWRDSWETGEAVSNAFAAVRRANASDLDKESFLVEKTKNIRDANQSALAFEWLGKVLASDGLVHSEALFLDRVEKMLFA